MRYLVKARLKPGREIDLQQAIADGSLGRGSVADGEYVRNMRQARLLPDGSAAWVEVCYCHEPLDEELPYWQEYFEDIRIKDAHDRAKCRDFNGTGPWECRGCDCTAQLQEQMQSWGPPFLAELSRTYPLP